MSGEGQMRYRLFGRSGLRVSDLCLGTMTFGATEWGSDEAEAGRIYARFRDAGGNFLDTANSIYAEGRSEEILGRLVAGHRDETVIASKYTFILPGQGDVNSAGNHRKSMIRSVEGSLRRLASDYIDILWLHCWDEISPMEEVMRALDDLVRQGKILAVGVSNFPAWVVTQANAVAAQHGWTRFDGWQLEYNLIERGIEREHLSMARAHDMPVCAWSPLASGLLTGKYNRKSEGQGSDEARRLDNMKMKQVDDYALAIAEGVGALAHEIGATPVAVALAWLRAQPGVIPILGARTVDQFTQQMACIDIRLTPEQLERLDALAPFRKGYPYDFVTRTRAMHSAGYFDRIDR